MLPDLPELRRDLQSVLTAYLQQQVKLRMPGLNEVPQHVVHEGARMRIVRNDGSIAYNDLKGASSEISVSASEVATMTSQERTAKLDAIAEDMARQISQHAFSSINEALEEAGQVVDHGGRRLDAEAILAAFDKMQMEFDERGGGPKNISVVVGPALKESARQEFERLESDPVLRSRYEALMLRKWVEWRDREASRKLVG